MLIAKSLRLISIGINKSRRGMRKSQMKTIWLCRQAKVVTARWTNTTPLRDCERGCVEDYLAATFFPTSFRPPWIFPRLWPLLTRRPWLSPLGRQACRPSSCR